MESNNLKSKMTFNPGSKPILTVMNEIENCSGGGLDLQPDYQRGFVWEKDFKDKLIFSIIKGYPIGAITIRNLGDKVNKKGARSEVIDGQQRLKTIYNFYKGDYKIEGKIVNQIITLIRNLLVQYNDSKLLDDKIFKKLNHKNSCLSYKDLPDRIKNNFVSFQIATIVVDYTTEEETSQYFSFLQNQERLRAGELINAIPETLLEKYYLKIYDIEKLLELLDYKNNRREFDKIFYSMIGIFDKKLNLGNKDENILNYVANKKNELEGDALIMTNNMISNINLIIEKANPTARLRTNKRYIKFLLLLAGFNFLDFNSDVMVILRKLEKINELISSFNSAKKDEVNKFFNGFPDQEIEQYRYITLIMKGSQNFNIVKERIEELADKIKNDNKIIY